MKQQLLKALKEVEHFAEGSKWQRLRATPARYLYAIGFRETLYRYQRKGKLKTIQTFFGERMQVTLPAGTDLYLVGGKTHSSEIRLARFMIQQLEPGDVFVDIGAHFGYFSLLAATLVGKGGKVFAFEAAEDTFSCLSTNLKPLPNCLAVHAAVNADGQVVTFFEFDPLHSEYNSTDVKQFEGQDWFEGNQPKRKEVRGVQLSRFLEEAAITPNLIKIDVEGGEAAVIEGALPFLHKHPVPIVMEYLNPERGNTPHREAARDLLNAGYTPHAIQQSGSLLPLPDIENWYMEQGIDSDNIVFVHPTLAKP
ncbi:FkbM family methyltransferase [Phaeodactylibacter xiamenensis]|uniref:FkbM family methyltransferase n=1 Tax=Phaeodactylibacter xiamenensis TaxID=1524460 RepID=UPI0024A8D820|nr:FkbM family methyltransferase [Phaeodactylibacter xiamenensis]